MDLHLDALFFGAPLESIVTIDDQRQRIKYAYIYKETKSYFKSAYACYNLYKFALANWAAEAEGLKVYLQQLKADVKFTPISSKTKQLTGADIPS